ncbi:Uncharacterised protein [Klebsiella pneumoniae]|uniref:Uncharacterized protein n=1 Tax=Klebsiella pneumoniae TaxID=573 RepID=A0A377V086_KLEPN|nr:Uncharacterised protein [Klebsiella pneumoniae]
MDRREIIHVINHAGGHHRAGAAGTLFSRLENQFNDAIELGGILLEHMRQPQPMAVWPSWPQACIMPALQEAK